MFRALRSLKITFRAYCPYATAGLLKEFGSSVSLAPYDVITEFRACRLFISHGGHSSVCQALLQGVPLLVLPENIEQQLCGRIVRKMGVGTSLPNDIDIQELKDVIRTLHASIRHNACEFSRLYKNNTIFASDSIIKACLMYV